MKKRIKKLKRSKRKVCDGAPCVCRNRLRAWRLGRKEP